MPYDFTQSNVVAPTSAVLSQLNIMQHIHTSRTPTPNNLTITSNKLREAVQAHVHPQTS
jgi:hypothetical protein